MITCKYYYSGPDGDERSLELTPDISIWLGRMLIGEAGNDVTQEHASALLHAITNRYLLWRPARQIGKYKNFITLLRAFSQPINPRWAKGGDLALKYKSNEAQLKRREYITQLPWSVIKHTDAGKYITLYQVGLLPAPDCLARLQRKRISNWASLPSTPQRYPWGIDIDGNWFFEDINLLTGFVLTNKHG